MLQCDRVSPEPMGEECSMTERREDVGAASVFKADEDEAGQSSVIPDIQTESLRPMWLLR